MTRWLRARLFACWLLSACNVASVQQQKSTVAQNQCTDDAQCPNGYCSSNQCQTANGTFETLLFSVTPPADASAIAGVQFLTELGIKDGLTKSGGNLDLPLDLVAQITGEVMTAPRDCTPKFSDSTGILLSSNDLSVPAVVSLTPSEGTLGLFVSPASANSNSKDSKSWVFRSNVPPGLYDIYVQPQHQPDESCVVPPQLLRSQAIPRGAFSLNIGLPTPSTFALHVPWPLSDGGLANWIVDMLDPISGRVISNSAALTLEPGGQSYLANLWYRSVVGGPGEDKAQELVRLSPPAGLPAPTVLLARNALSLFSTSSGTLAHFTALPSAVHVEALVTQSGTTLAAATVTFVATKIQGVDPGVTVSFVRTAMAGSDGKVKVDLLPGSYRVSAVPGGTAILTEGGVPNSDVKLAQASIEWDVGDSPSTQAGRLIELPHALVINGDAFDASGTLGLSGALVQVIPSPASIDTNVLRVALGETGYQPRASSASVALDGSFSLSSDSGIFDFSVRPQAGTNFPWLVIPSLGVGTPASMSAGPNLPNLASPLPVLYSGSVTVPGALSPQPVRGALIRTYIYMHAGAYTPNRAEADSVLQVAETRSDKDGNYVVLIPASLNAGPAAQ